MEKEYYVGVIIRYPIIYSGTSEHWTWKAEITQGPLTEKDAKSILTKNNKKEKKKIWHCYGLLNAWGNKARESWNSKI